MSLAAVLLILIPIWYNSFVQAGPLCEWEWNANDITDLRSATPLTYVWTATVSNCASNPTTVVESDTVTVGNTPFTAYPVTWIFNLDSGTTTVAYTYPNLLATILTPGDEIIDNYYFSPSDLPTLGTGGEVLLSVASTALVASPTIDSVGQVPSPTVTAAINTLPLPTAQRGFSVIPIPQTTSISSTNAPTGTPSKGLSVGAVAGIAIAPVIVLLSAAGVFLCYTRRTRKVAKMDGVGVGVGAPHGYEFEAFGQNENKYASEPVAIETYDEIPSGAVRTPL